MWFKRNNVNDPKMIKGLTHGWTFLFLFLVYFIFLFFQFFSFFTCLLRILFFIVLVIVRCACVSLLNIFIDVQFSCATLFAFHFTEQRAWFDMCVFHSFANKPYTVLCHRFRTLTFNEINLFTTKIHCLIQVLFCNFIRIKIFCCEWVCLRWSLRGRC